MQNNIFSFLSRFKKNAFLRPLLCHIKKAWLSIVSPPPEEQTAYCRELRKNIPLMEFGGMELKRIGGQKTKNGADGGYLMYLPMSENKTAYSIGINDDVSWDDAAADMGYEVFMYDHTINGLPHTRKEFHWTKKGLAARTEGDFISLEDMLQQNGHSDKSGMVLKIDIENCEWDVLENISCGVLSKFDQIAIEFHSLCDMENSVKKLSVLQKINKTHAAVHIHANNCGKLIYCGKYLLPDTLEATYLLRRKFNLKMSNVRLPRRQDMPNRADIGEIMLGKWNI